ncbi:UNVERIFIED_CONTAM: hypothetical protein K2H54_038617 [Gekko kuhli]
MNVFKDGSHNERSYFIYFPSNYFEGRMGYKLPKSGGGRSQSESIDLGRRTDSCFFVLGKKRTWAKPKKLQRKMFIMKYWLHPIFFGCTYKENLLKKKNTTTVNVAWR